MSLPETPALTEAQQILEKLDEVLTVLSNHADAINGLGTNMQWIVDNVARIFQMFGSPQFMSQIMGVMGNVNASGTTESASTEPASGPASG
jgi:hypothetical protein